MASKLWEKNTEVNQEIEKFTVGRDRELDLYLARYDVKRLIHILQGCEEVLLDGTERPIQRPLDEDRQSACYSGKKNS